MRNRLFLIRGRQTRIRNEPFLIRESALQMSNGLLQIRGSQTLMRNRRVLIGESPSPMRNALFLIRTIEPIIIVISDGWECGDLNLLEQEMKMPKRRCSKMLWLNPLLGDKNYEPLCKGMQIVLPYLDYFLPAHNVESLINLSRTLEQVAT